MRRIAIIGSSLHPDFRIVSAYVRELAERRDRGEEIVIISGGYAEVDCHAQNAALKHGLVFRSYLAQNPTGLASVWSGTTDVTIKTVPRTFKMELANQLLFRNTIIAIDCTEMTIFPEGSRGTGGCWDAAHEAQRFKRPVEIRHVDGGLYEYTGGFTKKSKGSWRQRGVF